MPHVIITETTNQRLKNEADGNFLDNGERLGGGKIKIWVDDQVFAGLQEACRRLGVDDMEVAVNGIINSNKKAHENESA